MKGWWVGRLEAALRLARSIANPRRGNDDPIGQAGVSQQSKRMTAVGLATGTAIAALAGLALAHSDVAVPSRMVLRASDLPSGFLAVRDQTGPHTNGDVVREKGRAFARKLRTWGRIGGFRAVYRQRDPSHGSLPGILEFATDVSLYRSARGAHAALADPMSRCKDDEEVVLLAGHRPFASDTLICTAGELVSGERLRIFRVRWRNGRATGSVAVVLAEGAGTARTAWTAARMQNQRMTAGLRS
jgi:hypothetical protein